MRIGTVPEEGPSLVEQAAARSTASLVAARSEEAARIVQAGLAVMQRMGLTRRAGVAEIVAEAGLSNQAFYRHFPTKDDLVAAVVDDGARILTQALTHKMDGREPLDQVEVWVRGVLAQATIPSLAEATRAVMWNRTSLSFDGLQQTQRADAQVWALLTEPLAGLGSADAERDAYLIGRMVTAVLFDALWAEPRPQESELEFVVQHVLRQVQNH